MDARSACAAQWDVRQSPFDKYASWKTANVSEEEANEECSEETLRVQLFLEQPRRRLTTATQRRKFCPVVCSEAAKNRKEDAEGNEDKEGEQDRQVVN